MFSYLLAATVAMRAAANFSYRLAHGGGHTLAHALLRAAADFAWVRTRSTSPTPRSSDDNVARALNGRPQRSSICSRQQLNNSTRRDARYI